MKDDNRIKNMMDEIRKYSIQEIKLLQENKNLGTNLRDKNARIAELEDENQKLRDLCREMRKVLSERTSISVSDGEYTEEYNDEEVISVLEKADAILGDG